jgi:hypothetical protein
MPAESDQSKTLQAQKIACTNNAAFVMNFSVGYSKKQDGSGGDIGGSGDYPINQTIGQPAKTRLAQVPQKRPQEATLHSV